MPSRTHNLTVLHPQHHIGMVGDSGVMGDDDDATVP